MSHDLPPSKREKIPAKTIVKRESAISGFYYVYILDYANAGVIS